MGAVDVVDAVDDLSTVPSVDINVDVVVGVGHVVVEAIELPVEMLVVSEAWVESDQ